MFMLLFEGFHAAEDQTNSYNDEHTENSSYPETEYVPAKVLVCVPP